MAQAAARADRGMGLDAALAATPGTLGFAFFLAMMTGVVDAVTFIRCGVLPSVMTANTVFLGVNAIQAEWETVALAALAIATFLVGSVVAGRAALGADADVMRRRLGTIEAVALGAVATIGVVELAADVAWARGIDRYVVVALATLAMAVQTPQVRSVERAPVSTTFLTGALSVLGYGLACGHDDRAVLRKDRLIIEVIAGYAVGGLLGGAATTFFPGSGLILPFLLFGAGWLWYAVQQRRAVAV